MSGKPDTRTPMVCGSYRGAKDRQRIVAFANEFPRGSLHVATLPYRLASWDPGELDNACMWYDESGRLIGYSAAVREGYATLDRGWMHPEQPGELDAALAWGVARGQAIADRNREPFTLYVEIREGQSPAALESHGFTPGAYEMVRFERAITDELLETFDPHLAPEFVLRPFRPSADLDAYVELQRTAFGTNIMTHEWRRRCSELPQYDPELHIVAEDPQGRLVGLLLGWMTSDRSAGHIEPGCVLAEFRRRSIVRALTNELIRRFHKRGGRTMVADFPATSRGTRPLWESMGATITCRYSAYSRTFVPAP